MTFELLEHPADIGFRASGNSLEQLFANCAHALLSIILDPCEINPEARWQLAAEGNDLPSLMVNWLNEVLFHVDTKRVAFCSFAFSVAKEYQVTCIAAGELRDSVRHPVRLSVKAVTYHQLNISQEAGRWMAEVYVDV